jgi:hypothetical protein
MTRTILAMLLVAGLAPAARADEAGAEAARSYRIETTGSTQRVKPGGAGVLVLSIVPLNGTHVHPQAPLKIALEASPGLALSKTRLGHKDAAQPGADGPRFEVPFTAAKAGREEARAKVDFFICSDKWCVKQVRDVSLAVEVK